MKEDGEVRGAVTTGTRRDSSPSHLPSSRHEGSRAFSLATGLIFIIAGALWLASSWYNIDPSAVLTRPLSTSSSMTIEWIGASVFLFAAGLATLRRHIDIGAAIAVPTLTLGALQVLLCWFPLYPYVRTTGSSLIALSVVLSAIACFLAVIGSRSSWHLTSFGLWSTVLLVTPVVAWGITYLPSWYTYHYTVTSGYFTATGTHFLTVDGGSSFSSGIETSILSLLHAATPILLIIGACWWWRHTTRTIALLAVGLNILFISADGFFGLGDLGHSYDPTWWGWAHHGTISVTPTFWLWVCLGASIVYIVRALMLSMLTFSSKIPEGFEASHQPILASIEHDFEIESPEEQL